MARILLARQIVKNRVTNWQVLEIVEEILSRAVGTNLACAARLVFSAPRHGYAASRHGEKWRENGELWD